MLVVSPHSYRPSNTTNGMVSQLASVGSYKPNKVSHLLAAAELNQICNLVVNNALVFSGCCYSLTYSDNWLHLGGRTYILFRVNVSRV